MLADRSGSLRLFRLAGIEVFLHWSWFLIAAFEIGARSSQYSSPLWNALEYLTLFAIVLTHEFGHALACRSVGGQARQIVLWPLGGVAFVDPPPRPGATLWSVAAGPLVNVALVPVTLGLVALSHAAGWAETLPDLAHWVSSVALVNAVLLVFNLLPIYPLDGGQVLRSLLWYLVGRARSLMVATTIGFVGAAALLIVTIALRSVWMLILTVFMVLNCWRGLRQARALVQLERLPRRPGYACPTCGSAPPTGAIWSCPRCQVAFDTFETGAACPQCGGAFTTTSCVDCGRSHPISAWLPRASASPGA